MEDDPGGARPAKLKLQVAAPLTVELPKETHKAVELWGEAKGVSVEDILLDALDIFMRKHGRPPLERARAPFDIGRRPRGRTGTLSS